MDLLSKGRFGCAPEWFRWTMNKGSMIGLTKRGAMIPLSADSKCAVGKSSKKEVMPSVEIFGEGGDSNREEMFFVEQPLNKERSKA